MRFYDADENIVYWYHGIDVHGQPRDEGLRLGVRRRLRRHPGLRADLRAGRPDPDLPHHRRPAHPARRRDDRGPVRPLLPGPRTRAATSRTWTRSRWTRAASRSGANQGKKNWNSVGDHAPAYLINLYLATGEERYADFLEYTFDTIAKHFPDYEDSPFVQEKFFEDWSPRPTHMWQQNRGVVGHNLKIAWNLMRMNSLQAQGRVRGAGAQDRRGHAGRRQRPAARRLVRRDGARAASRARSATASPSTTARRGGSRSRASWPT